MTFPRPRLELADSGAILEWHGPAGAALLKVLGDDITVDIGKDGEVRLSTTVRDRTGAIVAELVKNEWKVNPERSFDRNYSRNAIEVRDPHGDVVLQARVLKDRVQLAGSFHDHDGNAVLIGKMRGPDGKVAGVIEIRPRGQPLRLDIEQMFRYPSELHLGEPVNESKPRKRARYEKRRPRRG